jgi:hypothetical protein
MIFWGFVLIAALFFAACQNPTEEEKEYTITVNSNITGGRIIPVPEKAKEGTKVTLVAAPAVYYTLREAPLVSANNNQVELSGDGQSEPYSFIMPAANVTVLPNFVFHSSHNTLPIYTGEDLALIGHDEDYPLNGIYLLQDDITLPDEWAPIGDGKRVFSGIFDGSGKTIAVNSFLYEDEGGPLEYTGVFGCVATATIKNLTLNLDQVEVRPQGGYFGFLVGYAMYSELQNITVTGDFEINLDNTIQYSAGTIAGVLDRSQLQHGSLNGNLTVSRGNMETDPESTFFNNIGGMAGLVTGSSIRDCAVIGNIDIASLFMRAGGIAGNVEESTMTGNSITGNLSVMSNNNFDAYFGPDSGIYIGGLAGSFSGYRGSLTDSAFDGNLFADLDSTTPIGYSGVSCVGGVIGQIMNASANSISVDGNIEFKIAGSYSRDCRIGGVAGTASSGAKIQNSCFNGDIKALDGSVAADNYQYIGAGGIIGHATGSTTNGCYASGIITATNEDPSSSTIGAITRTYAGGIAGSTGGANEIDSCHYTGNVTSVGVYSYAGGIVGYSSARAANENKVTNCYTLLENVTAKGSGTKPATNWESNANSALRIAAGGIMGRMIITFGTEPDHKSAVEYCAALFDSGHAGVIKAEGNEDIIFAGRIVGNRNIGVASGTTASPGGILTGNVSNIPDSAIAPYIEDISAEDPGARNGVYHAALTQESFFNSPENGGLGWNAGVWTWDSVKGLPKLAWQD